MSVDFCQQGRGYRNIVFDIDDTLTDERAGLRRGFEAVEREFGLGKTWAEFAEVERRFWADYRAGEVVKPAEYAGGDDGHGRSGADWVRAQRFARLVGNDDLGRAYQMLDAFETAVRETVVPMPEAVEVLGYLKEKGYRLIAATDGVHDIAMRKLEAIGVLDKFEGVYSAHIVGVIKPNVEFFAPIFADYGSDRRSYLMVGNSLAADVLLAENLGIDSVLVGRGEGGAGLAVRPTYRMESLAGLKGIL